MEIKINYGHWQPKMWSWDGKTSLAVCPHSPDEGSYMLQVGCV